MPESKTMPEQGQSQDDLYQRVASEYGPALDRLAGAVFHGVVEEVGDDLIEAQPIPEAHDGRGGVEDEGRAVALRELLEESPREESWKPEFTR